MPQEITKEYTWRVAAFTRYFVPRNRLKSSTDGEEAILSSTKNGSLARRTVVEILNSDFKREFIELIFMSDHEFEAKAEKL